MLTTQTRKSSDVFTPEIPVVLYNDKILDAIALAMDPSAREITFEGTIRSAKTVTAIQIFHLLVQRQTSTFALIAAENFDSIRDNILKADRGLMTMYPELYHLMRDEIGGYYVEAITPNGIRKILLCGYADTSKWQKILGKDIETILIDEANVADKQFVDECHARQGATNHPVLIQTLNGDDPQHWLYQERINKSIIVGNCPASTRADMDRVKVKKRGYYYVWWGFDDNPKLTLKQKTELRHEYPKGSYYHKTKVLGERGKWGSLIYADYMDQLRNYRDLYVKDKNGKRVLDPKLGICKYVISCDVAENKAFNVFILHGYDATHSNDYILDCEFFKSNEGGKANGYAKKTLMLKAFIQKHADIKQQVECIVVDSAEDNYIRDLRNEGLGLSVIGSWKATIKQRIDLVILLLNKGRMVIDLACLAVYQAFQGSTWVKGKEGVEREDSGNKSGKVNDILANDIIDATEYGQTLHMFALSGGKMRGETAVNTA